MIGKRHGDGTRLAVRVAPRASREGVDGVMGEALKVRLTAPPVDGKANAALLRFLSKALKIPASGIRIVSGASGRDKVLEIDGLTPEEIAGRLGLGEP